MSTVQEIERRLQPAFTSGQSALLAAVISDAYNDLVKTSDFSELKTIMRDLAQTQVRTEQQVGNLSVRMEELANAQGRTEVRMEELANAQVRTEVRIEELANAQVRTEVRMEELANAQAHTEVRMEGLANAQVRTEVRMEELASAQARTEQSVAKLAVGLDEMRGEVGGISRTIGYALENDAYRALPRFLEAQHGLRVTDRFIRSELAGEEINFLAHAVKADGTRVLIVGESKARLDERRDAQPRAQRIFAVLQQKVDAAAEANPGVEIVSLIVTHYARPAFLELARQQSVIVVQSFELA